MRRAGSRGWVPGTRVTGTRRSPACVSAACVPTTTEVATCWTTASSRPWARLPRPTAPFTAPVSARWRTTAAPKSSPTACTWAACRRGSPGTARSAGRSTRRPRSASPCPTSSTRSRRFRTTPVVSSSSRPTSPPTNTPAAKCSCRSTTSSTDPSQVELVPPAPASAGAFFVPANRRHKKTRRNCAARRGMLSGSGCRAVQLQQLVAGAHGVVVHLAGRALLVAVFAVVDREDAVPGAVLVVDEVLPRVSPQLVVPRGIAGVAAACVQQGGGGERFGLHPEVLVVVAHAAVGGEAVAEAAMGVVPGVFHCGVEQVARGGQQPVFLAVALQQQRFEAQQQLGPLGLVAGLEAPRAEQVLGIVPVVVPADAPLGGVVLPHQ